MSEHKEDQQDNSDAKTPQKYRMIYDFLRGTILTPTAPSPLEWSLITYVFKSVKSVFQRPKSRENTAGDDHSGKDSEVSVSPSE